MYGVSHLGVELKAKNLLFNISNRWLIKLRKRDYVQGNTSKYKELVNSPALSQFEVWAIFTNPFGISVTLSKKDNAK